MGSRSLCHVATPASGVFELSVAAGADYPMRPPKIAFVTPIFHPNVLWRTGEICLDILKQNWTPAWDLQGACRAILALLSDPAADSPLNCDAGVRCACSCHNGDGVMCGMRNRPGQAYRTLAPLIAPYCRSLLPLPLAGAHRQPDSARRPARVREHGSHVYY